MTILIKNIISLVLFGTLVVSPAFALAKDKGEERGRGQEMRTPGLALRGTVSPDSARADSGSVREKSGRGHDREDSRHEEDDDDCAVPSSSASFVEFGMLREHDDDDDCAATTTPPVVAPIISNVAAAPNATSSTITWTTDTLAASAVFYGTVTPFDPNATTTLSVTNPAPATSHSFTLSNLAASTTYIFVARSSNAAGTTTSIQYSFVTAADTVPPVLSPIVATSTATSTALLTWTTDEPATSKVFYGTTTPLDLLATTTPFVMDATLVTNHSISISGLATSTTYHLVAQSVDAFGNAATSSDVAILIP